MHAHLSLFISVREHLAVFGTPMELIVRCDHGKNEKGGIETCKKKKGEHRLL